MIKLILFFFIIELIFTGVYSQDKPSGTIQIKPTQIIWSDAPSPMPVGSKMAVLEGNPKQDGIFTMRVMIPPYIKIPVHIHPYDERVTVISGAVYVGFGEKLDTTIADKFIEGCYYVNPVNSHHYVFTGSEGVIIQITGMGPWSITYIEDSEIKK
jgi:quercetin dioxygenase-like cupin family protein